MRDLRNLNVLSRHSLLSHEVKRNLLHHEKNLINLSDTSDFDSDKEETVESEVESEFKHNLHELEELTKSHI